MLCSFASVLFQHVEVPEFTHTQRESERQRLLLFWYVRSWWKICDCKWPPVVTELLYSSTILKSIFLLLTFSLVFYSLTLSFLVVPGNMHLHEVSFVIFSSLLFRFRHHWHGALGNVVVKILVTTDTGTIGSDLVTRTRSVCDTGLAMWFPPFPFPFTAKSPLS